MGVGVRGVEVAGRVAGVHRGLRYDVHRLGIAPLVFVYPQRIFLAHHRSLVLKLSVASAIIEHMFEVFGEGAPEGWEPIPDEVRDELEPFDLVVPPPAGMVPAISDPDDLVWQAIGRSLGVDTLPLLSAIPVEALSEQA